jgi:lysophospholipase L1-like esterase
VTIRARFTAVLVAICSAAALCACSELKKPLAAPSPECPAGQIVGWGDSLTWGATKIDGQWEQVNPTWLQTVGTDLDVPTENFGVPSQGSAEIAVRQGGLKPMVTLTGNQIPAFRSAAIPLTAINPTDGWSEVDEGETMKMHGTLAGVAGTLQLLVNGAVDRFSFLPDAAPTSSAPVPPGSVFSSSDGDDYRDCMQIIWAGTNNSRHSEATTRDINSMVQWLTGPKKYLIIGMIPAINEDLRSDYGARFEDLRSWLIADGLRAAGITPTAEDAAAVAAGDVPPSLTVDGVHFTQAAYTAIGHHLSTVIKGMGGV